MWSDKEFINYIEKSLNNSVKKAGEKMANKLEASLAGTQSEYYDRTGEIVDAFRNPPEIKVMPNGDIKIRFIDFDKIISRYNPNNFYNWHMSLDGSSTWKGVPVKEMVPEWLNDGFTLPSGARFDGYDYVSKALGTDDIDDYTYKIIMEALNEYIKILLQQVKKGGA